MAWISMPMLSMSLRRSSGEENLRAHSAKRRWLISRVSGLAKKKKGSFSMEKRSLTSGSHSGVEMWQ
jgi:hypothetical protein